jgi:5-oxoprolinase (ATP-hydrolysing)
MPPFSKHLYEEGAAIVSFKLVAGGVFDEKGITALLDAPDQRPGCSGTRNLHENLSDLKAQVAANTKGIQLMGELITQYSLPIVQAYMRHIQRNAEEAVRDTLREIARQRQLPADGGNLIASDYMDDGTEIKLCITIDVKQGSAVFDFTGTGSQVFANWNAPQAVTVKF